MRRIKSCSLHGGATCSPATALSPQEKPAPRARRGCSGAETRARRSAKTPALPFGFFIFRAAPGTRWRRGHWGHGSSVYSGARGCYRLRHRSPSPGSLADGVSPRPHCSWIFSICPPRPHPCTAWAQQAQLLPAEHGVPLKTGTAQQSLRLPSSHRGNFTFCIFLGISGTCSFPHIGSPSKGVAGFQ